MSEVESYLKFSELTHSLGQRTLRVHDPRGGLGIDHLESPEQPTPNILHKLLSLLLHLQRLVADGFDEQCPAPWATGSQFMSMKRRLDNVSLRFSEDIIYNETRFQRLCSEGQDAGNYLLYALLWNCCGLNLNRSFLPIRLEKGSQSLGSDQDVPYNQSPTWIRFPSAPDAFLRERISRCLTSACNIARICENAFENNVFMLSPLMGYCCLQAALVFISQLRSPHTAECSMIVEKLKVVFTVVGTLKKFFAPAHVWAETLFKVHDQESSIDWPEIPPERMFRNFFTRYSDVEGPPVAPFEPFDTSSTSREVPKTTKQQRSIILSKDIIARSSSPITDTLFSDWLPGYQDQLQSYATELGDTPLPRSQILDDDTSSVDESTIGNGNHASVNGILRSPISPLAAVNFEDNIFPTFSNTQVDEFLESLGSGSLHFPGHLQLEPQDFAEIDGIFNFGHLDHIFSAEVGDSQHSSL